MPVPAQAEDMKSADGILALVDDQTLATQVDRVVAAAGLRIVRASEPSSRRVWTSAAAVLLDTTAARRCVERGLPRRPRVLLITADVPAPDDWQAAVAVGAQQIVTLPTDDHHVMAVLADATGPGHDDLGRGPVVSVVSGRGGGGASVFATALAQFAAESLAVESFLVDGDPWGGGLDLVLGSETEPGLRWPDLALAGGRVGYPALRDALPRRHGVTVLSGSRVLSGDRPGSDIDPAPLSAVIDAGSRAGVAVVCDVARRPHTATEIALAAADLVVLVTPADLRSCAAAAATARWVTAANPNTGVVVRGPAPGGLRPADVARIVGLPVLAAMRPQPGLDAALERGGLRVRARSPLARAAREVLSVLDQNPHLHRAAESAA
ncbi:ATPase AAA [Mycolicibacterium parafortuitum]|uniref:ATPase AAA n=2 Tax=Mycolicibacterium parafortuitum TaxID=39692 RepID=A0A7I7U3L3_MYCPF|nr:ATPase AAA [Mycolicibacterium parafortuitum]